MHSANGRTDYHSKFWTFIAAEGALEQFSNLRRDKMSINGKALQADLLELLRPKEDTLDILAIDALCAQGADLIAGVLNSEGRL